MKSSITQSEFEKTFTTRSTFRRNRHYYDALKIREAEHQHAQQRRRPRADSRYKDGKVHQAFRSAKKSMEFKVEDNIEKFKFRMSFCSTQLDNPELPRSHSNDHSPSSP
jgi:hypothetical protein